NTPRPMNPLASKRSALATLEASKTVNPPRAAARTPKSYQRPRRDPRKRYARPAVLTFSQNPDTAEQQMNAIIFYLTAFGYIDGDFDFTEKTFVRIYIRQLVTARAKAAMPDADPVTRDEVIAKFVNHFHEVFEQIDRGVKELFDEAVAD